MTSLTGTYGEKFGFAIGNSYEILQNGVPTFQGSFEYWTDPAVDRLPAMLDQRGKTHPAP